MKKIFFSVSLIAVLAVAAYAKDPASDAPAASPAGKFVPADGQILLLVGQDRDTIENYIKALGTVPGGFMVYTSVQKMDGLERAIEYGSGPQHMQHYVDRYPDTVIQIGLYMVKAANGVLEGTYDQNLMHLADWIKSANRPVYVRIGYEFDNPENQYDPETYQKAFRYIVDKLKSQGVTNAAYVWHSYAARTYQGKDVELWYPGDDYVDWFAVSFFGQYETTYMDRIAELAMEHHKPLMIAESATEFLGTIKRQSSIKRWFERCLAVMEKNDVKALCYINSNWDSLPMYKGQGWGDTRVEADGEIKEFWFNETGQAKYLQSSPDLFKALDYEPD